MKIRHKMLLGFLPIALLSVAIMTVFSQRVVKQILVREVIRRGISTSLNMAGSEQLTMGFMAGDERILLPALQRVMETAGAVYAMVLDREGTVLAHTNVAETGKRYVDTVTQQATESDRPEHVQIEVRGQPVIDISCPVWELEEKAAGEEFLLLGRSDVQATRRLGTVRLGLPLREALDTAEQISTQVLWIISLVSILTMLLILFYMRALLRPVRSLALAAERIGHGQVGETVSIRSDDEMGELAASLNQMSLDLAVTTVSRDFLDSVLRNMQDIVIVTNADGTIRLLNQRALSLLGRDEDSLDGKPVGLLFPDGQSPIPASGEGPSAGEVKVTSLETSLLDGAGEPVPVLLGVTTFGLDAVAQGFVITATDITERKAAEERIRSSLEEKEMLLKEIHHRVKNNLQIISSLLSLQAGQVRDAKTLQMFSNSQNRIASMALIHERLYRSNELARVDFAEYVRDLTDNLFETYQVSSQRIQLQLEVDKTLVGIDEAIPCGLIINELVLNALKHAFPDGREGILLISFRRQKNGDNELIVRDDGVGLPAGIDLAKVDSLGVRLVTVLVTQLGGRLVVETEGGAGFRVLFPSHA